ncbi:MAG: double-strand break repair protein AddB [Hyphomonadaceae bacterium]
MTPSDLFSPDAPKVWTIPPGANFLQSLANTLADATGLRDDPAALADAQIYVPNRRSARAMALALFEAGGNKPILPPSIRALGDLETDEPPSGAEEALTKLGPALPPARRLGALANLVMAFYRTLDIALPPASAISAARELGRLLDSAALSEDVDWSALPDLVERDDLAVHWAQSAKFLQIVTDQWPTWLKDNGATEPFARRRIVAEAIAAALEADKPKGIFLIAGSTGATPASRALMQAACKLERGVVVFPGLDLDAAPSAWPEILEAADHPQHALAGTLSELGRAPQEIPIWPGASEHGNPAARRRLIHESLAPAVQTADWLDRLKELAGDQSEAEFAQSALEGLSLVEAEDGAQEALIAALALREALETEGRTAALVTPDAGMARQVAAILKRWDINTAPSGGVPLSRTASGAFVSLALDWACDTGSPVALTALLKHEFFDIKPADIAALEICFLRGTRRWGDIQSLQSYIPAHTDAMADAKYGRIPIEQRDAALSLIDPLATIARDHSALFAEPDGLIGGPAAVTALTALINALIGDETRAWTGTGGEAASRMLESVSTLTAELGAMKPDVFVEIAGTLSANVTVQANFAVHPRIAIWGPLEARLQQADRIILAGLNESVWPAQPTPDAFLPRRFRKELGLTAPEARLGLAAHDFAQLATAPDVLMLYAARRDDAPAVPSRWVLRLRTLVEGALGKERAHKALSPKPDADPRIWAKGLRMDTQTKPAKFSKPEPCPPVSARPKKLSVTRINTLQRDPYTIYAGSILGLSPLAPLDAPLDARPRGTAIHAALEDFETLPKSEQTAQTLQASLAEKLHDAGSPEHIIMAERAVLGKTAQQYVEWWQARQADRADIWTEEEGEISFEIEGEPFKLTGIADSVEKMKDGTYTIIDFKTGKGKTRKEILAGFEQQLPLLALIASEGQLKNAPGGPVGEFGYVSVRYQFESKSTSEGHDDAVELRDASRAILTELIAAYRQPDSKYFSVPRVQLMTSYAGDFDRLARRAEWAGDTSDG